MDGLILTVPRGATGLDTFLSMTPDLRTAGLLGVVLTTRFVAAGELTDRTEGVMDGVCFLTAPVLGDLTTGEGTGGVLLTLLPEVATVAVVAVDAIDVVDVFLGLALVVLDTEAADVLLDRESAVLNAVDPPSLAVDTRDVGRDGGGRSNPVPVAAPDLRMVEACERTEVIEDAMDLGLAPGDPPIPILVLVLALDARPEIPGAGATKVLGMGLREPLPLVSVPVLDVVPLSVSPSSISCAISLLISCSSSWVGSGSGSGSTMLSDGGVNFESGRSWSTC